MQLKRQSVEAWQNEKHYSKENNTSKNPIPRREIFKSVDHVKYEGQVRSDHNICCLCSFLLELSSCRVTYKNCYKSSVFLIYNSGQNTLEQSKNCMILSQIITRNTFPPLPPINVVKISRQHI